MRLKICVATTLILALACGGGGVGASIKALPPIPILPAPSSLTVSESGVNELTLAWTPSSGTFDGYELEGRIGSAAFQKLHEGLVPKTFIRLIVPIGGIPPEDTTFSFRLRAARGASFSSYTNEAVYTSGPNPPGQPTATYNWGSASVSLSWDRNTTSSDGLRIERAECTQSGSVNGTWTSLPTVAGLASTYVDTGVSPNLYHAYRITNLKGARAGQPSAPSRPVYTGLVAVSSISAIYDPNQAGVAVSWWSDSSAPADGVRLERADSDAFDRSQGNWTVVALPTGYRTTFLDQTVVEGGRYFYRVSNLYGTTTTPSCTMYHSIGVPMLPPINLQATPTQGGIQLTWQNRSTTANQLVIRRNPSSAVTSDIAILSPDITTYLDAVTTLGYYTYTVVAKGNTQEASSTDAMAGTLNRPGSLALTAAVLDLPFASDAALRPSGGWAFARTSPLGVLSNKDPWPATFPSNFGRCGDPLIQVDRNGWPHAVYATPASSGTRSDLIHLWYDGVTWKSETIASASIPSSSANSGWTYRLDSTGTPHVLLDHVMPNQQDNGSTASLSYVHKVNGAWVEESLAGLSPQFANIGSYHITLDGSDMPHLLIGNPASIIDYVRIEAGVWSSMTIPTGPELAGRSDFLDFAWADGNNGWVFIAHSSARNVLEYGLWVIQMKSGAWQTPVLLGTRIHDGANTTARVALAPDQTRLAVLFKTSIGVKVYDQASDGWHETLVAPCASAYPLLRIGFDANQKVHILSLTTSEITDYHE